MTVFSELWSTIIPSWLTAIGTIGAVCVALFYRPLANFYNRPKLQSLCNKKTPFVEEITSSPESSEQEKEARIRMKVVNNGKSTADHCVVNVSCYLKKREDDTYCKMVFAPILIKDYRCSSPTYISPNITYLLDVAAIRKIDEIVSSTDGNMSHQFYKLVLLGDKNCVKLGKGTFVIPINISSPRMKTHNAYLKIYWCSDDFCLDDEHFSVEVISEKDFNSLKIN